MKKKDVEQLAEIALRANAGDDAQAGKMAKRLWRVRRWAAESSWRLEANDPKRGGFERLGGSLDQALRELEEVKRSRELVPVQQAAAAPAPGAAEPPAPPAPKSADEDGPLVPKKLEDKVALAVDVEKSGVTA